MFGCALWPTVQLLWSVQGQEFKSGLLNTSRSERKTQSWSLEYLFGMNVWSTAVLDITSRMCCQTWRKYNETFLNWPRFRLNVLFPVGCPHAVLPVFFFSSSVTNQCQHQQTQQLACTQRIRHMSRGNIRRVRRGANVLKPFSSLERLNNSETKYNVLLILFSFHYISYSKNMNERGQHTRVQVTERTL